MSSIATETSFDALIETIKTGSRSSRASSYSSTFDGSVDTPPRKASLNDPRDSGIWGASDSPKAPGKGQHEVAQHHLQQPRRDTHRDATSPTWSNRARSDSTASSVTDKTSHSSFMLRHGMNRRGSLREEPVHPEPLAKIMLETPRHPGAHRAGRPGCILSSAGEMQNLRGRSTGGRPVWWCRFDNMVVFEGMTTDIKTGAQKPRTRSSKGLPVANAKGRVEVVHLELGCEHCKEILKLNEWKYAARVCERGVCAACRVRCVQENERGLNGGEATEQEGVTERDLLPAQQIIEQVKSNDRSTKEAIPMAQRGQPKSQEVEAIQTPVQSPVRPDALVDRRFEPMIQKAERKQQDIEPIRTPIQSPVRSVVPVEKKVEPIERIDELEEEPSHQTPKLIKNSVENGPELGKPQHKPKQEEEPAANESLQVEKSITVPQEALPLSPKTESAEKKIRTVEKESPIAKDVDHSHQIPPRDDTLESNKPVQTPATAPLEPPLTKSMDPAIEEDAFDGLVIRNLDLEYESSKPLVSMSAKQTEYVPTSTASKPQGFLSGWKKPW